MKKLVVFAMLIMSAPAYAATLEVTVSDKDLASYCSQGQFNTYKPEHNPDAKPFDCEEFVTNLLVGQIEQGAHTIYAQAVAEDVESYRATKIAEEKQK